MHILGFAFTSPVALAPAFVDSRYATYLYGSDVGLHEFIVAHPDSLPLVFCTDLLTLRKLLEHQDIDKVYGVIVFDDAINLGSLANTLPTLDLTSGPDDGWRQLDVDVREVFNFLADPKQVRDLSSIQFGPRELAALNKDLTAPATARDLIERVVLGLPQEDRDEARRYCSGLVVRCTDKTEWLAKVAVPYQERHASREALIEFERYADASGAAIALWTALFDIREGIDSAQVTKAAGADPKDLAYIEAFITPKATFLRTPPKATKRKARKKKAS